eukprot:1189936-Rhodomonas_salina.3
MLRLLAEEEKSSLRGDVRQVLSRTGSQDPFLRSTDPNMRSLIQPVFLYSGRAARKKGRAAEQRRQVVQELAEGHMSIHTRALCPWEFPVLEKQDDENANMDTNTEANATSEWDILALDCAVDLPHLSQAMCALKQQVYCALDRPGSKQRGGSVKQEFICRTENVWHPLC